jgi:D-psicose/D-tagatose/L-ribulose 3-epimerase
MNNKVGISFTFWCRDWSGDFSSYAKRASKIGFDILEMSLTNLLQLSKSQLTDVKKIGEDLGLGYTTTVGLPSDKDLSSSDPKIRKAGIEYVKQLLDVVHYLNSPVLGGLNFCPWPAKGPLGLVDKAPYVERSVESLTHIMPIAEAYKIDFAFEIVNRFEQFIINTAEEGAEFCRLVNSPRIKIHLDTFHMNIEEESMTHPILDYPQYIGYFHAGEANRKAPYGGRLPWNDMFAALSTIDYKGPIVLEPFIKMGGQVGYDSSVWRDLSGGADEAEMDQIAKRSLAFIRGMLASH